MLLIALAGLSMLQNESNELQFYLNFVNSIRTIKVRDIDSNYKWFLTYLRMQELLYIVQPVPVASKPAMYFIKLMFSLLN